MSATQVQWGKITFHLDNETFRKSFRNGRSMYFDDSQYEFPHVACHMNTLDAVGSVLNEDSKGGYCFDSMAFKDPLNILGFFLGYMSSPLITESQEEHEERDSHTVLLSETGNPMQ